MTRRQALTIEASSTGRVIESAIPLVFGLFGWLVQKVIPVRGYVSESGSRSSLAMPSLFWLRHPRISESKDNHKGRIAAFPNTSKCFRAISLQRYRVARPLFLARLGSRKHRSRHKLAAGNNACALMLSRRDE